MFFKGLGMCERKSEQVQPPFSTKVVLGNVVTDFVVKNVFVVFVEVGSKFQSDVCHLSQ